MSAADAKDASELAGVLEEYVLRCLFSKNWQLREAALQYIERQLSGDVSFWTTSPHWLAARQWSSASRHLYPDDPCGKSARKASRSDQAGGVYARMGLCTQNSHATRQP